jgi:hypothetical protein
MHDTDPQYIPCTMPVEQIITLLNTIDPLVSKLKLLGDLSPLADEAPMADKGRLEGALARFANRLPRCHRDA